MPTASSLDLEDIEDLVAENANSLERNSLKKAVLPHPRITAFKNKSTSIETVANQKSSRQAIKFFFLFWQTVGSTWKKVAHCTENLGYCTKHKLLHFDMH